MTSKVDLKSVFKAFENMAATKCTCLSEERLTELIKSIFKEEFEIKQKNIVTLISGNFEITMQQIKKVNNEINELKTSIEHTDEVLQERMEKIKEKYDHINSKVNEIYEYQMDPQYLEEKLIELEDRSRRCNLRRDGVEEGKDETWDQCEEKVLDIFTNQLGIEKNVQIERAHRTGKKGSKRSHEKTRKSRTIVLKLNSYKDKIEILKESKKLKGTNIYINEDFSAATMNYRKELWKEVQELRQQGKIAYLNYRSIIVK